MSKKILVIDDDIELCSLIRKYLQLENYIVSVEHDGDIGLREIQFNQYDLIVLDIMLPGKNGFEILTEVRKNSNIPILMLTAKDSEIDKVTGLRMGADDYLTKPFSMNELVARVLSLLRRCNSYSKNQNEKNQELHFEHLDIIPNTREVFAYRKYVNLTAKEFDLLYFMASNSNRVFTKKQIYKEVWNEEYEFDDNNIMVHIRRLRKKIEKVPEEPEFIKTVWGVGYKFGGGNAI